MFVVDIGPIPVSTTAIEKGVFNAHDSDAFDRDGSRFRDGMPDVGTDVERSFGQALHAR
jgi:hypothetical protein